METFCHNCDKFVNVKLKDRMVKIPFARDVEETIWCLEFYVVCDECGEELYLPCVNDINCLLREREIYRARKEIHSIFQEIKSKLI